MQFTDIGIRALKPPTKGHVYLWDGTGLGLRISAKGTKAFCVLLGSGRRQTIGRYGPKPRGITLSEARAQAKHIIAERMLGKVRPKHVAFEDALNAFLVNRAKTLRERTISDYRRLLSKHYPYGRSSVGQIVSHDILARLDKLPPAERHHAFAAGRAFFRFCVSQHYVERSPMADMESPPASRPRERVLNETELRAIYNAAINGQTTFHRIITLCLLTGQRRGEISRLERSWLKDDIITIPSDITKNGRTHAFPIGPIANHTLCTIPKTSETYFFPAAREQVKGKPATVFNGWGKPKAALDEETGTYNWTIHDIRRTVSSGMAALGIPQVVVEKLLNHVSGGSQSQIARIYNLHKYQQEMREAVEKWEARLASLL